MFPILSIGGLAIQMPGLLILVGLWTGLSAAERGAHRHGIPAETLYNLVFFSLIAGVIGARLAYAGQHLDVFIRNPIGLLSLRPELLDPLGGLAAAVMVGVILIQRRGLRLGPVLDALTPLFAVVMISVPAANFASGDAYGAPAALPWSVELWGAERHPAQVYEVIAALGIFIYLEARAHTEKLPAGTLFLNFIALSAGARLFLEVFRGESAVIGPGLRAVQLAAWVVMASALFGLWRLMRRGSRLTAP
jgi:phosphatidylglycerol:prolipoprotein diacylglycerol transferase